MWESLTEQPYFDHWAFEWAATAVIVLLCVVFFGTIKRIAVYRLRNLSEHKRIDAAFETLADVVERTNLLFYGAVGLFIAMRLLDLTDDTKDAMSVAMIIALFGQVGFWGNAAMHLIVDHYRGQLDEDPAQLTALSAVRFLGQVVVWTAVVLMVLDNLGFDITAVAASLGIGGVAVALAVQNILGDLFASISIVIDKPFVIGDFVIVGDMMGTVEKIGLKTTRVRSLSGEQLVFSNSDLLNSRIRNFKRMAERRVVFSFGVVYQTSPEQLREIPPFVQEVVERNEQVRFDRAHFKGFGASSLDFEVVYYVLDPDYNLYMDIQQDINLALFEGFAERGIDFAYPTRTVYMASEEATPDARETHGKRTQVRAPANA